jgi:hypothetical protein
VRSYRFARCAQNGLILAAMLSPLLHQPAAAQWGRHFSAAVGPAIVVDDAPPHAGATARAAGSLWPGPRTLNLLADGYLTWLAPGSEDFTFIDGSFNQRLREIQFGVDLSALVALSPEHSVSPYLLAGGVYRGSDIRGETTIRDQSGQVHPAGRAGSKPKIRSTSCSASAPQFEPELDAFSWRSARTAGPRYTCLLQLA